MNKPLSNFQIESILGAGSLPITYSQLNNYNNIEELLPSNNSFKIILLRDSPNSGHWVCITKNNDKYNYFNSFGDSFNQDLYLIPSTIRKILGSYNNKLNELLKNKDVEYNKIKFQRNSSAVCGRYVVLFIIINCFMGYSLKQFNDFLINTKKKHNASNYDELVLILTQTFNSKITEN